MFDTGNRNRRPEEEAFGFWQQEQETTAGSVSGNRCLTCGTDGEEVFYSGNRKRRQEEEDAAAEAIAEQLWATESLPPGTSVAAIKAAAGCGRGRPSRTSRDDDDEEALMPRLPGHLGSAVIQEAAALADVACASAGAFHFKPLLLLREKY